MIYIVSLKNLIKTINQYTSFVYLGQIARRRTKMQKIMEEYTSIINEYIFRDNKKIIYRDESGLFEELNTFWLCEYQHLVNKLQRDNNELRTYSHYQTVDDIKNIVERSALYADKIIIPDISVGMGVGFIPPKNISMWPSDFKSKASLDFLSVVSEFTDWINEGIVVIIPDRLHGIINYDLVPEQRNEFYKKYHLDNESLLFGFNCLDPDIDRLYKLVAKEILSSSGAYGAFPSTNTPAMWNQIIEVYKEDEIKLGRDITNIAAMNSLELNFLNNVPLNFAKDLRNRGYLAELRKYIREKFKDIQMSPNDSNFPYKIKEISTEINDEITMHEHEWTEVKRELRNNLAIGITGVAAGTVSTLVTEGISTFALLGILGASMPFTAKEIIQCLKNQRNLKKNGIHLLFELKKDQQI